MKLSTIILDALKPAPATSAELAEALDIDARNCASILTRLHGLGVVKRKQIDSSGGRPPYLYQVAA